MLRSGLAYNYLVHDGSAIFHLKVDLRQICHQTFRRSNVKYIVSFRQGCVRPGRWACYVHSVAQETADHEPEKRTHS